GFFKNRKPVLGSLKAAAERIEKLEPEIHDLSSSRFREEVQAMRDEARLGRLIDGPMFDRAMAVTREAVVRAISKRPFPVQLMGALAMVHGNVAEMATGEGKTLTAAMAASIWAWGGKPVHIITVNDYLVQRDAEHMGPIYEMLGLKVGFVTHETTPQERLDNYRRGVVYITSKELVADFLRDQIALGNLRTSTQTVVGMMAGGSSGRLTVPGLFRVIVDEADSLLIDEAVTPLIISNSPDDEANATLYRAASELADMLDINRDFIIDFTVRNIDLTQRGQDRLDELTDATHQGDFWKGRRRREELVTQALVAKYCYIRDEQYLVTEDQKVQIIDEFTGRVMADRSWRHGLHQAIEVKENVPVTADKENLARLSFQRFFRQYPIMGGMTGTAWESAPELWQIYQRPVIKIPTNKPCIRVQLPLRFFDTMEEKWEAVIRRIVEVHETGAPVLVGTRSVLASQEVSRRLAAAGKPHRVLNASHTAEEAAIIAEAGQASKITVATNMAGRGTDIILGRGVAEIGGLHVISTEPAASFRVDRQLYGRAARQGDPGCAQLFACAEDDLFLRHAARQRKFWRAIGANRLIKRAQLRAENLARFNRKQVLKNDDWMDEALPF
ncbi:MAG: preprotein translocase subunit SecA, partial [Phycisphaerales bacterium]|nr:preprotein translocase subunit SecA [Phycisphaerales bacterium]